MMNTSLGMKPRSTNTFDESRNLFVDRQIRTFYDPIITPLKRNGLPSLPASKILNLDYDKKTALSIPTKKKYIREKVFLIGKSQSTHANKKSLSLPRIS